MLWEHGKTGRPLHGFTDNYIRVECPTVSVGKDNTLSMVELGDFTADGKSLAATLVE